MENFWKQWLITTFNVTHSNPQDQKLIYEVEKDIKNDIKPRGRKSNRVKSPKTLPKSPAIVASVVSKKLLPENFIELCDRIKLYLPEKQVGIQTLKMKKALLLQIHYWNTNAYLQKNTKFC